MKIWVLLCNIILQNDMWVEMNPGTSAQQWMNILGVDLLI